ncbi:vascular-related unknown protein 1-like [Henckelia pumila]|uniref:vascular-related unknown protein 1-like n=1 Tax=Henckelia pumila TaxID=405737 RepID=UPI003C6E718F
MESHMNSSFNNIMASEESGWSAYVDDFPLMNQTEDTTYYCPDSSLVSDAAWTGSFDHKNTDKVKKPSSKNNRRSSRKKYFWQDDDDLEDTACSPANSPKVSSRKMKMKMKSNYKAKDDDDMEKQVGGEEKSGKTTNMDERENDYFDLKKKGLCLVPYSSFVDYNEYDG